MLGDDIFCPDVLFPALNFHLQLFGQRFVGKGGKFTECPDSKNSGQARKIVLFVPGVVTDDEVRWVEESPIFGPFRPSW